jgi:hypothetical protein
LGCNQQPRSGDHHDGGRRRPVGEEIELLFLDPVLDIAAGAVDVFVERAGVDRAGGQRGDHEAGVRAVGQMLGFGDDPPVTAPAVQGAPGEVGEAVGRAAVGLALSASAAARSSAMALTKRSLRASAKG